MTGRGARNKGANGEREFFRALSVHLGESVTRNLAQTRDGGADGAVARWWIEVKRQEELRLNEWWAQAYAQARAMNGWPALAYRRNRQRWRVIVALETLAPTESPFWGTLAETTAERWTAEISLEAFAAVVRESLHEREFGAQYSDPLSDEGSARETPKNGTGGA